MGSVLTKYPDQLRQERLIVRLDSGYGASKNIAYLANIKGLKFIAKGILLRKLPKLLKLYLLLRTPRLMKLPGYMNFPLWKTGLEGYWFKYSVQKENLPIRFFIPILLEINFLLLKLSTFTMVVKP